MVVVVVIKIVAVVVIVIIIVAVIVIVLVAAAPGVAAAAAKLSRISPHKREHLNLFSVRFHQACWSQDTEALSPPQKVKRISLALTRGAPTNCVRQKAWFQVKR